jgi:lipopolysaccharide biosynthesis protein
LTTSASDTLAALKPLVDVRADGALEGAPVFVASGADPQMLWRPEGADRAALAGHGAVRVRIGLKALEGRLTDPCLYADWGDGFSEETRATLRIVEPGLYTAVSRSNGADLRRLRIDPTSSPGRFVVTRLQVEPAEGEPTAAARHSPLKRLLRKGLRRLPLPLQRLLRTLRAAVRGDAGAQGGARRRLLRALTPGRTDPWREAYVHAFEVARNLRSPHFAAPPMAPPAREADGARLIAFHLPQFHPIPENDAWWGRGFTEWSNVSKATPQFRGHLQPRLPADLGFYDLRLPEVLRQQADLARRTGVDGFCFHYYWFGGRRLLEGPLDAFAADPEIDLPFALSWANENWTRRWDGQESDILIAQQHSPEDDLAVFDDMARYMRHPRYIRVGGKPLLMVYRPDILPEAEATVRRWRARARETGLGELFLLCTNAFGFSDYAGLGFDGIVEFPPHAISLGEITDHIEPLNVGFAGRVYDYDAVVAAKVEELSERADPRSLPGVMPAWDNEARKPGAGHVFHNAAPEGFRQWLLAALDVSRRVAPTGERLVFVNAWNEWAEGAYLEPDRWFGHGFAQAARSALETRAPRIAPDHPLVVRSEAEFERRHDAVVLLHLFYPELIEEFAARLQGGPFDIAVTFSDLWTADRVEALAQAFPAARLLPVPNQGRDLAPFLEGLRFAQRAGHALFCKLHSKRSPHRPTGTVGERSSQTPWSGPRLPRRRWPRSPPPLALACLPPPRLSAASASPA